jgi:hypothetical protein
MRAQAQSPPLVGTASETQPEAQRAEALPE